MVLIWHPRILTTPELLPYFDIDRALHTLLTPEERARPWLLYLIPGILPGILVEVVWTRLIVRRLRKAITPLVVHWDVGYRIKTLELGFLTLDIAVLLPLEALMMRLALMDVSTMVTSTAEEQVLRYDATLSGSWSRRHTLLIVTLFSFIACALASRLTRVRGTVSCLLSMRRDSGRCTALGG